MSDPTGRAHAIIAKLLDYIVSGKVMTPEDWDNACLVSGRGYEDFRSFCPDGKYEPETLAVEIAAPPGVPTEDALLALARHVKTPKPHDWVSQRGGRPFVMPRETHAMIGLDVITTVPPPDELAAMEEYIAASEEYWIALEGDFKGLTESSHRLLAARAALRSLREGAGG